MLFNKEIKGRTVRRVGDPGDMVVALVVTFAWLSWWWHWSRRWLGRVGGGIGRDGGLGRVGAGLGLGAHMLVAWAGCVCIVWAV